MMNFLGKIPKPFKKKKKAQKGIVGDYKITKKIAQGPKALICDAVKRGTKDRYVLKMIPKVDSTFKNEIDIHAKLDNCYIIELYEIIEVDKFVCLVMERARCDLMDYISEMEEMPEEEICRLFQQICLAVAYMHKLHIAHLDIKPENVFLDKDINVKLGDFGMSMIFKDGESICQDKDKGTLHYNAPEIQGGLFDPFSSDVWSLGICLYVMATGSWPYEGNSYEEIESNALDGNVYFHPNFQFSDPLQNLIESLLEYNPEDRPTIFDVLTHPFFGNIAEINFSEYSEMETESITSNDI
eukprot:TRINITY_DN10244_c0_g1_i1.p1 TRINITY_DN10244_c0_g1~~TRINITY_DN10244_c0_g1_i1.p1  ORF type:complete len:298 (-),score=71.44 TRINITY_DN10244_c0_g1_i1:156-1049(-)